MRIQYTLTPQDILVMNQARDKARSTSSKQNVLVLILAGVLFIIFAVFQFATRGIKEAISVQGSFLFGIPVLVFVLWFFFKLQRKSIIKKQFSERPMLQEPITVDLDDHHLLWTTATVNTDTSWNNYQSYLETDMHFFLFISPSLVEILPKRAFTSDAEIEQVRSFLTTNIGAVFPKKRLPATAEGGNVHSSL